MNSLFEKIDIFIDSHKDDIIANLRELIGFESIAGEKEGAYPFGKKVGAALERMLVMGDSLGLCTQNLDNYAGLFDLNGNIGKPSLGVLCHIDVVPAGDGWTHPPFGAEIDNGRIFGRGAIDDKGPAVSALWAIAAVKSLGMKFGKDVRLIVGTNEENGSSDMRYCEEKGVLPEMLFSPDADYPVVNIEKGLFRSTLRCKYNSSGSVLKLLHGGDTLNVVPSKAEAELAGVTADEITRAIQSAQINLDYEYEVDSGKLSVFGETAHASTPELGKNALTALLKILSNLEREDEGLSVIRELSFLFPHNEFNGASAGLKASDELSGELTLNFSILEIEFGNVTAKTDVRFPICESLDSLTEKLKNELSGSLFELSAVSGSEPHYVPEEGRLVSVLKETYESVTGKAAYCRALGGATYVHHSPGGVAFGPVSPGNDNRLHAGDEFISIDELILNTKMYARAILKLIS